MKNIIKRFYHPGYGSYKNKQLCLPFCKYNSISKYIKPVWK